MTTPRRPAAPKVSRGEVRRREILIEAARVFLRDGLDATSMDLIASEAGTSKATIYRHFGDRHGLVVDVVEFLCADFLSDLDQSPAPQLDLHAGLRRVLMQLVHVLSKPDHPAFFRLVTAGTSRDPGIGTTWYEHGPSHWYARLREVFVGRQGAGELPADHDFEHLPEILFDAVFSEIIMRTAILGEPIEVRSEPDHYVDKLIRSLVAVPKR